MRNKKLKLGALLLLSFGLTGVQAQTMYVKGSTGTQTAYSISNLQKMSFSSGNLTVTKTDNSSGVFALNGLNSLNFSEFTTRLDEPMLDQSQELSAFPNPVSDLLNINLSEAAETEGTLSLLNIEGQTLESRQVTNEGVISLDIRHLPKGVYLFRYSSATEVKTVKVIKQ